METNFSNPNVLSSMEGRVRGCNIATAIEFFFFITGSRTRPVLVWQVIGSLLRCRYLEMRLKLDSAGHLVHWPLH
jgi:hypothetical protein